jgi:SAM-dependent methyltransferase
MHGVMGNRHIDILAAFMSEYGALERNLKGKEILDVGCWTGGASLLLTAMGANVVAVEEVRKYADCLEYLKYAFGLDTLQIQKQSLYSLDSKEFFDRFDIVLYSGVLYHVTDPVLSLRILFNCLKDGGTCLVETQAITGDGSYCEYEGAYNILSRPKGDNLRQGWNWFVPTVKALSRMMKDVGFDVRKAALHEGDRALAIGVRAHHVDMLRAGLSRSHIR